MRFAIFLLALAIGCEACHPKMGPVAKPTTPGTTQAPTTTPATTTTTERVWVCDDGWTTVVRTMGGWCMKVINLEVSTANEAEQTCTMAGGVISSVENDEEMQLIGTLKNVDLVFLGATLKTACECSTPSVCTKTATCSLQTAYTWSDGFTTGTQVFAAAQDSDYGDALFWLDEAYGPQIIGMHASVVSSTPTNVVCGKQAT
ncbi:unnamed protein product [Caenorhabditis angaria]|uniref:C-type lectin domain-containing protein n=1 Tax=Caenorhabditis angaria TaxID=860376 RepID=A0A9P1J063_9PELO|nr:unnamed protein product [Caenorhabditis angaria]